MRLTKISTIFTFVIGLSLLPNFAQAFPQGDLEGAQIPLATKIASWGIKARLPILKAELFNDALRFKAGFEYNVEPSFNGRYFSRYDTYYFNPGLHADDVVMDEASTNLNVGGDADYNVEVNFVRQFEQAKDALIAWPYFAENLPLTSERALNNLQPGDFVSIKSRMIVTLTGSALQTIAGLENFPANAGATYAVSGLFQLHILRLEGTRVRVKLVASRDEHSGLFADVGYGDTITNFSKRLFNRAIERLVDLNVLSTKLTPFGTGMLVMSEYDLDLSNPIVAEAFEKTVKQSARFNGLKEIRVLIWEKALQKNLIVNMAELEDAYNNQQLREAKAISRTFKGTVEGTYSSFDFKIGNRLAKLALDRDYSRLKIKVEKEDRTQAFYVFDSYLARDDKSVLAGFRREEDDFRFNGLYNADERFRELNLERVVISYDQRDKLMTTREYMKRKSQLDRTLFAVLPLPMDQYDFSNWWPNFKRRNVATRTSINLSAEGLLSIPYMSKTELKLRLLSFLEAMPKDGIYGNPRESGADPDDNAFIAFLKSLQIGTISQMQAPAIADIVNKLHRTFDRSFSVEERLAAFFSLRSDQLFHWIGPGFMIALLDSENVKNQVGVKFTMQSTDGDTAFAKFGNMTDSDLYANLLRISKLIRDDGLDLLLESEEIKGGHSTPQFGLN